MSNRSLIGGMKAPQDLMSRSSLAPGIVGASLLLQLGLVRAVASVGGDRVFVAGREWHRECWFSGQFDFPCPTCGLTRSVIHTLHGQFVAAWQLNPAGLFLVSGLALLALALVFLTLHRQRSTLRASGAVHRRIRLATKAYAHFLLAVLFAHWMLEIATR
jgi:hypothetical protein